MLTDALAVLAYFQSEEANLQRSIADTQRSEALHGAAKATRQRDIADDRRRTATLRLAADRLRAGGRAGGLLALVDARPKAATRSVLVAGLRDGSQLHFAGRRSRSPTSFQQLRLWQWRKQQVLPGRD